MNEQKLIIGIQERPKNIGHWIVLSLQHVFAMVGATVLVPLLTGLDTGVALVASGIGTIIYIICTKGKVPVYLGSSFAYITAISVSAAALGGSFASAYLGLMIVGVIYMIIAMIIRFTGSGWLKNILPPVVIGPMIIIIGMTLAPTAVEQSGLMGVDSLLSAGMYGGIDHAIQGLGWKVPLVAISTFAIVVVVSILAKGFWKIIPFVLAMLGGYALAAILGLIDWSTFSEINLFQIPNFSFIGTYKLDFSAVLMFIPLAFVTIAEHIGDHTVLGEICDKDFITDPGLSKTLLGDGLATFVSAAIGGPANTTYGENTGVIAISRVGSVYVTGLAAVFAILLGFLGYIQAFFSSIPWAVIGGMTIILYGLIAGNGVKVMIKNNVDLGNMKNLIIVSTMLVIGLGGAFIVLSSSSDGSAVSTLSGMSLAAIVGIVLNMILNFKNVFHKKNN
ncbi:MAG: solute carrier family 23 protein [Acholeplasmataceae bacterium]